MTACAATRHGEDPPRAYQWWRCPNDPPCLHAGVFHDVYDEEDQVPRCCAEGCNCGKEAADARMARQRGEP